MIRLVIQRLLAMIPLLLAVAVAVFALFSFVPVDVAAVILGQSGTLDDRAALRSELGLDRPAVERFAEWLLGAVRGDFGTSYLTRRPVMDTVLEGLPITLTLVIGGLVIALVLGIVVGTIAALRPGSWLDRAFTGGASVFQAMPEFWLALLLVWFVAVLLGLLPIGGYVPFEGTAARVGDKL